MVEILKRRRSMTKPRRGKQKKVAMSGTLNLPARKESIRRINHENGKMLSAILNVRSDYGKKAWKKHARAAKQRKKRIKAFVPAPGMQGTYYVPKDGDMSKSPTKDPATQLQTQVNGYMKRMQSAD